MITYKINLIRTGNTSSGDKRAYVGRRDLPLCDNGKEMLNALKEQFEYPKADVVYSSPLKRCLETADILYPDHQVIVSNDFIDMDIGEFTGKTYDQLESDPDFVNWINNSREFSPPGGEGASVFTQRLIDGINAVFNEMMNSKMHNVSIITHGSVIMSLLSAVGVPKMPPYEWALDNGIGYMLSMTPQMWMRDFSAEILGYIPLLKE